MNPPEKLRKGLVGTRHVLDKPYDMALVLVLVTTYLIHLNRNVYPSNSHFLNLGELDEEA